MNIDIAEDMKEHKHTKHHTHKHAEHAGDAQDTPKDTRNLIILLGIVVGIILIFAGILFFTSQKQEPVTIDSLHEANLKGELDPEVGYMYNGYSFIHYADQWYTQLQKGQTTYDITFNYDPKSIEDVPVDGQLTANFVNTDLIWITFDPLGRDLKWVGVANYGLTRSLAVGFGYQLKAACTKNETKACEKAGVVTCDDTDKSVIYLKEAEEPRVVLADNCVIVQGRAEDLVKAKDRLLLRWYGITDK